MIPCRKCGKVCRKGLGGLCPSCHAANRAQGHGSSDYRHNADLVRQQANDALRRGDLVRCGICNLLLVQGQKISIDHRIRLRDGGSNHVANLRPVHSSCNARDH